MGVNVDISKKNDVKRTSKFLVFTNFGTESLLRVYKQRRCYSQKVREELKSEGVAAIYKTIIE